MEHCIVVKFKDRTILEKEFLNIEKLFKEALKIKDINNVIVRKSNSNLSNRYDLLIEMDLSKTALISFDSSDIHSRWKDNYKDFILNKVIFDSE